MPSRARATEAHSSRPALQTPPSRRPAAGPPSTFSRPGTTRRPSFTPCASNSGIAPFCHSPRSACSTPKSKWGSETPRKTFNSEGDRDAEAKEGHDAEGRDPAEGGMVRDPWLLPHAHPEPHARHPRGDRGHPDSGADLVLSRRVRPRSLRVHLRGLGAAVHLPSEVRIDQDERRVRR